MTVKQQCLSIIHELSKTAEDPTILNEAFWKIADEVKEPAAADDFHAEVGDMIKWHKSQKEAE